MVIDASTVIRRNPRVVHRNLGDEKGAVILHLDTTAYHGVNEIGTMVWTLLEQDRSFAELLDEVRARVLDPPDELQSDIAAFVQELKARDLVLFVGTRTAADQP